MRLSDMFIEENAVDPGEPEGQLSSIEKKLDALLEILGGKEDETETETETEETEIEEKENTEDE